MPFCPKCRSEYKIGVTSCPDCRVELIDRLTEPLSDEFLADDDVDSVLLYETGNYMKAHFVVGALEEAGIPCWSKRLGLGGRLGGSVTGAISHVVPDLPKPAQIYVHPHDLPDAQKILQAINDANPEDSDE